MKFVEEFRFSAKVTAPIHIGKGPYGTRTIYEISGGEVTGERISGKILGGADWSLIGDDRFLKIDVRAQVETHDGANLYFQYNGLLGINDLLLKALEKSEPTEFGDQYCYTNLRIETGDERYSWVNTTFFIGEGRNISGGVEYRVCRPA